MSNITTRKLSLIRRYKSSALLLEPFDFSEAFPSIQGTKTLRYIGKLSGDVFGKTKEGEHVYIDGLVGVTVTAHQRDLKDTRPKIAVEVRSARLGEKRWYGKEHQETRIRLEVAEEAFKFFECHFDREGCISIFIDLTDHDEEADGDKDETLVGSNHEQEIDDVGLHHVEFFGAATFFVRHAEYCSSAFVDKTQHLSLEAWITSFKERRGDLKSGCFNGLQKQLLQVRRDGVQSYFFTDSSLEVRQRAEWLSRLAAAIRSPGDLNIPRVDKNKYPRTKVPSELHEDEEQFVRWLNAQPESERHTLRHARESVWSAEKVPSDEHSWRANTLINIDTEGLLLCSADVLKGDVPYQKNCVAHLVAVMAFDELLHFSRYVFSQEKLYGVPVPAPVKLSVWRSASVGLKGSVWAYGWRFFVAVFAASAAGDNHLVFWLVFLALSAWYRFGVAVNLPRVKQLKLWVKMNGVYELMINQASARTVLQAAEDAQKDGAVWRTGMLELLNMMEKRGDSFPEFPSRFF